MKEIARELWSAFLWGLAAGAIVEMVYIAWRIM